MSILNRQRGNNLTAYWVYGAGPSTVVVTGDYTKFDVDRSSDLIDATAGNAGDHEYLASLRDASAKLTFFDTGTQSGLGTALGAALEDGTPGSLFWGHMGTNTGKPKFGFAGFVKSAKHSVAPGDAQSIDAEFQKSGAMLFSWGSFF
jgi:hypothetical protein